MQSPATARAAARQDGGTHRRAEKARKAEKVGNSGGEGGSDPKSCLDPKSGGDWLRSEVILQSVLSDLM